MSLFSRFFGKPPPDGLLELTNRVYVFDSCFSIDVLGDEVYQTLMRRIATQIHEDFIGSEFLAINFRDGEKRSPFAKLWSNYDVTVIEYPKHYGGCPILPIPIIHHFLRVTNTWVTLKGQRNVLLLHCERHGWPLLAFFLACFLIYRKIQKGDQRKTLDMIYKEAPWGLLQKLSPLNPIPSQLRYLSYVAMQNKSLEWPPFERDLTLDCLILRDFPTFDSEGRFQPFFRIFGRDTQGVKGDFTPQLLFPPAKNNTLLHYQQVDYNAIQMDIRCVVQGDVVLECIRFDVDSEREVVMFRAVFNTAFIQSNILMLKCEDLDMFWDVKELFSKDFRAEIRFEGIDFPSSLSPPKPPISLLGSAKGGLSRIQENPAAKGPPPLNKNVVDNLVLFGSLPLSPNLSPHPHKQSGARIGSPSSQPSDATYPAHPLSSSLDGNLSKLSPIYFENPDAYSPRPLKKNRTTKLGLIGPYSPLFPPLNLSPNSHQELFVGMTSPSSPSLTQPSSATSSAPNPLSSPLVPFQENLEKAFPGDKDANLPGRTFSTALPPTNQENQDLKGPSTLNKNGSMKHGLPNTSVFSPPPHLPPQLLQQLDTRLVPISSPPSQPHATTSPPYPVSSSIQTLSRVDIDYQIIVPPPVTSISPSTLFSSFPSVPLEAGGSSPQPPRGHGGASPSPHLVSSSLKNSSGFDVDSENLLSPLVTSVVPPTISSPFSYLSLEVGGSSPVPPRGHGGNSHSPHLVSSSIQTSSGVDDDSQNLLSPSLLSIVPPTISSPLLSLSLEVGGSSPVPPRGHGGNSPSPHLVASSIQTSSGFYVNSQNLIPPPVLSIVPPTISSLFPSLSLEVVGSPPPPPGCHGGTSLSPHPLLSYLQPSSGVNVDSTNLLPPLVPSIVPPTISSPSPSLSLEAGGSSPLPPRDHGVTSPASHPVSSSLQPSSGVDIGSQNLPHPLVPSTMPPTVSSPSLSVSLEAGGSFPLPPRDHGGTSPSPHPIPSSLKPSSGVDVDSQNLLHPIVPSIVLPTVSSPSSQSLEAGGSSPLPPRDHLGTSPSPHPIPSSLQPSSGVYVDYQNLLHPLVPSIVLPTICSPSPSLSVEAGGSSPLPPRDHGGTSPSPHPISASIQTSSGVDVDSKKKLPPLVPSIVLPTISSPSSSLSLEAGGSSPLPPRDHGGTSPCHPISSSSQTSSGVDVDSQNLIAPLVPSIVPPTISSPSPSLSLEAGGSSPIPPRGHGVSSSFTSSIGGHGILSPLPLKSGGNGPNTPNLPQEGRRSPISSTPLVGRGAAIPPSLQPGAVGSQVSLTPSGRGAGPPPPPPGGRGRGAPGPPPPMVFRGRGPPGPPGQVVSKKWNLKSLFWVKIMKVVEGTLWHIARKEDDMAKIPKFDMSELESIFPAAPPASPLTSNITGGKRQHKEKVHLVDMNRAKNCEIMLTKVKIPLPGIMNAVLALDSSVLDLEQVENLIKFCPKKEEMDLLRNYKGDIEDLGKCEHFFLELMRVPRTESKLRVFAFNIQFPIQIQELREKLETLESASREVRESVKLRLIMQTILSLGNSLNQGTARGSAVAFKLDIILKLPDTRGKDGKTNLMSYLCKFLAEKLPEVLDFSQDLEHLEAASKMELKLLAEEMQALNEGVKLAEEELISLESDGPVSNGFREELKSFLDNAVKEVESLKNLFTKVGQSADSLVRYFGEDPARGSPFEEVVSILLSFTAIFRKAVKENAKQIELEKKKADRENFANSLLKQNKDNLRTRSLRVESEQHSSHRKFVAKEPILEAEQQSSSQKSLRERMFFSMKIIK